jgi:hypothetical protein
MTLQFAPLRIALAFLTLLLATGAPVLGAVERLSLSEPVAELEKRLSTPPSVPPQPGVRSPQGARPEIAPYALVLDRDSLDPKSTDALLTAIADLRAAGGRVVAIRPKTPAPSAGKPIDGGVAVLALACDALAFESGATIAGATADWCTSATKRTELAEKLARLGRIDPLLAARVIDPATDLSWTSASGISARKAGEVELATAGQPIELSAATLNSIAIEAREFKSVSTAIAAIERGELQSRDPAGPKRPARGMGTGAGAGAPAAPPQESGRSAGPKLDPEMQTKVDAKLKQYSAALSELKRDLDEFDRYFTGSAGTWTTENQGLKEVWEDKSDNTRHADTKVKCERLQRSLKENVTSLGRIVNSVDRMVKDRENPVYTRLKANQESLAGLREALERNKVDDYERFRNEVRKLK